MERNTTKPCVLNAPKVRIEDTGSLRLRFKWIMVLIRWLSCGMACMMQC